MRRSLLALLCALPLAAPATLHAQVSTNDQALDTLKPDSTARAAPAKPEPHTRRRRTARSGPPAVRPQPVVHPVLTVPNAPPPNPVIAPPPLVMPSHPPPPPPPVPLRADAAGTASAIAGGTRITFGQGAATLNPATFKALQAVAVSAKANPALIVTVTAWAPGTADDPSTPRRLALDRALAARAVLINAGLASERIHAVAKGMTDIGSGPADRVDVTSSAPGK